MLHDIQKQFLDALFNTEESPEILSMIDESGSRNAFDQFEIYRESVIAGILGALTISYPVIKKLIGERFFEHISYQYIKTVRSLSPDLNNYGLQFVDFIDTLDSLKSVPYLSDVARLEWAWQKIINGENYKSGNLHRLSELNEQQSEQIQFQLRPHTTLLHSKYPIDSIWQANQNNEPDIDIKLNQCDVKLLIWRNEMKMNITPIEHHQWYFLSFIAQNILFTEVCEKFSNLYPQHNIGETLTHAIQSSWVHSYKVI